jgi:hypothetical protein
MRFGAAAVIALSLNVAVICADLQRLGTSILEVNTRTGLKSALLPRTEGKELVLPGTAHRPHPPPRSPSPGNNWTPSPGSNRSPSPGQERTPSPALLQIPFAGSTQARLHSSPFIPSPGTQQSATKPVHSYFLSCPLDASACQLKCKCDTFGHVYCAGTVMDDATLTAVCGSTCKCESKRIPRPSDERYVEKQTDKIMARGTTSAPKKSAQLTKKTKDLSTVRQSEKPSAMQDVVRSSAGFRNDATTGRLVCSNYNFQCQEKCHCDPNGNLQCTNGIHDSCVEHCTCHLQARYWIRCPSSPVCQNWCECVSLGRLQCYAGPRITEQDMSHTCTQYCSCWDMAGARAIPSA